jgi:hypothetical protein
MTGRHSRGEELSQSRDGSREVQLGERIREFFDQQFRVDPRTPVPEIRPGLRVLDEPIDVSIVVPADDIAVRYTLDGSAPSASSKKYERPFAISADTTVKAVAVSRGKRDSTVASASFFRGPVPPRITRPVARDLQTGRVGERYEVRFEADRDGARWNVQGDLCPYVPWRKKDMVYPNGMRIDPATGVWSGTPTTPGRYWVQIWVNDGVGRIARCRDFVWVVEEAK